MEQLKSLWNKIQGTKKISYLVSYYEDVMNIFYENSIYRFSNLVERFGEKEAFELDDLYSWYEDFTHFYNFIQENQLRAE